jgi:hypothetical protein
MRFGVIKTLVENKLIESFKKDDLKINMKLFKTKLLSDKSFVKMMNVYNNLNENKELDKETANYLIDDLVKEFKSNKLSEGTMSFIKKWTSDVVNENKYETIDDLVYGDDLYPEKKSIARKSIVESLGSKKVIKESKSPKVPLSTMLNVANKNATKFLETLSESERNEVLDIMSLKGEKLNEKFTELKENTISKIDSLINESDEDLKKILTETKNKLVKTNSNKKEYIKLLELSKSL